MKEMLLENVCQIFVGRAKNQREIYSKILYSWNDKELLNIFAPSPAMTQSCEEFRN